MIGDDVTAAALELRGKSVHLRIDASAVVQILRAKLVDSLTFALKTPTGQKGYPGLDQLTDTTQAVDHDPSLSPYLLSHVNVA